MSRFHITSGVFGAIGEQEVHYYSIVGDSGIGFIVSDYGATLLSVVAPDRNRKSEEITLHYKTLEEMIANHGTYYGAIAGRVANRIAKGTFAIDGTTYKVAVNNGQNHLHGGLKGFDQVIWKAEPYTDETNGRAGVELRYTSVDGEEGYPGNLEVVVKYELNAHRQLVMTYQATTDKATPINLTNHTYWNLSGNCRTRIYDQTLQLSCSKFLPVPNDGTQIPTGELRDTAGTLFDFSTARPMRAAVLGLDGDGTGRGGLDHCFVVDGALHPITGQYQYDPAVQRGAPGIQLRHVATLADPVSGRTLTLHATQPALQVYTGNWLDNTNLTDDADQSQHANFPHILHNSICLETQHFPDSVNQSPGNPFFPSVVLRPEEDYFHQAVFTFGVEIPSP